MTVEQRIRAVIAALDRVCPACLAAQSEAQWAMLHRGRRCATSHPRGTVDGDAISDIDR